MTLLSVISAFAVVSLHTNGVFWHFSTERYWITANIVECVYYFAVPIFFMISGVTLLDYPSRYSTGRYFKKRCLKTVLPFLFWSLFGLLFHVAVIHDISINQLSFSYIFNGIVDTKFVSIYWFFIPLFMIYLSIPLFAHIAEKYKMHVLVYLAVVAGIIDIVLPFIHSVFSLSIDFPFSFDVAKGHLIFPILGYILSRKSFSQSVRYTIYSLAALGLLLHVVGTYVLSMEAGEIIKTYKGYTNLPCVLYSVGIFLFIKENGAKLLAIKWIDEAVEKLKPYTYSIYILHWFIMTYFVAVFHIQTTSIWYRLLGPIPIILVCVFLTWLIRKLPAGKSLLP